MKPRTKLHIKVLEHYKDLYPIDDEMLSWAKVNVLKHKGYATKSRVICMDCGQKFSPDLVKRKQATCPHCGQKLIIEDTRKSTDKQNIYVAKADICGEFQIVRNFEIHAYYKVGKPVNYFIWEVLVHFIIPNGKHTIVGRNHTVNSYCDSWNGDMEIRKDYNTWYSNLGNKYDIYPQALHPSSRFFNMYKKYGIDSNLRGLTFLEAITKLPNEPRFETLLKAKQYKLLERLSVKSYEIRDLWPSIKICLRNKYIVKDARIWIDYIGELKTLGKDFRNAKYVCPKNLMAEHTKCTNKIAAIRRKTI